MGLGHFGNAWVRIADMALLYVLLALGLNIVVGYAGLLDLGYVAFFAVGAAFGLAAGFTYSLKLRRQLTALKKELRARQQTQVTHDPSDSIAD